MIEEAGRLLNLKRHAVGPDPGHPIYMTTPADLEIHRGLDGLYYALDFSRLFPPEARQKGEKKGSFLYELLRPEFVMKYKIPLCPDT